MSKATSRAKMILAGIAPSGDFSEGSPEDGLSSDIASLVEVVSMLLVEVERLQSIVDCEKPKPPKPI